MSYFPAPPELICTNEDKNWYEFVYAQAQTRFQFRTHIKPPVAFDDFDTSHIDLSHIFIVPETNFFSKYELNYASTDLQSVTEILYEMYLEVVKDSMQGGSLWLKDNKGENIAYIDKDKLVYLVNGDEQFGWNNPSPAFALYFILRSGVFRNLNTNIPNLPIWEFKFKTI